MYQIKLTFAQDVLVNGTEQQREVMAMALEGERGVIAMKIVSAHEASENLHSLALAQPQGTQRDADLVTSSQAKSRAADLQREYAAKYLGGHTLGGREIGESRTDYDSASSSFATRKKMAALDESLEIMKRIWNS